MLARQQLEAAVFTECNFEKPIKYKCQNLRVFGASQHRKATFDTATSRLSAFPQWFDECCIGDGKGAGQQLGRVVGSRL